MTDEEHSEPGRTEEGEAEEPRQDEHKTLGTVQTIEGSTINPLLISATLGNQNNQNHQSP
jgi:hypothetical protein